MTKVILLLLLLLTPSLTLAQSRPMFRPEAIPMICGYVADHVKVLEESEFRLLWTVTGQNTTIAMYEKTGLEYYWVALVTIEGQPDMACIIDQGAELVRYHEGGQG